MNIGQSIRALRKTRKMSQGEFSALLGIAQAYLSQIEHGRKKPSLSLLEHMAVVLKVPLPILFWFGVEAEDIREEKRQVFLSLKGTVDAMMREMV